MIGQIIEKELDSTLTLGRKYYSILCIINSIPLTETEVDMIVLLSGGISLQEYNESRKFSKTYLYTMVGKLKRYGFLLKTRKITVNPILPKDLSGIILKIKLWTNQSPSL